MSQRELILLPVLKASMDADGRLFLTQKYLDGANEYAKSWPGPVTTLARITEEPTRDLDPAEVFVGDGPNGIEIRPPDSDQLAKRLGKAAGALAFLGPEEEATLEVCSHIGVPMVFVSEYAPKTERQIVDAEVGNPIVRARRKLWLRGAERARRRMLSKSAGLQCSGTPTYELYRPLQPNALLFFDNRVRTAQLLSDDELAAKAAEILAEQPLRLVFGGRLAAMKGVGDLPDFVKALLDLGVDFSFDIVGDGPQAEELRSAMAAPPLSEYVTVHEPMEFLNGWLPFLKSKADLFICPHPQGDPSSTYPEVMSCGVAIAGYENEAFAGVASHSGSGFLSPIGSPEKLAQRVAELDRNRQHIVDSMTSGLEFARKHAFEPTFSRRMDHMMHSVGL